MIERNIKTAVITGPTGAIGSALCRCLADNGIHVYAIVHPGSKRVNAIANIANVDRVECDVADLNDLVNLIHEPVDVFYHLAWIGTTGLSRNDVTLQVKNIEYTNLAATVASKLHCKLFIGAGSQAEYGRVNMPLTATTPCFPENGYGIAKLCAGNMSRLVCEQLGIEHIWVRILSVYGPHDNQNSLISMLINRLQNKEHISTTNGEQIWDYLYEEDAAEALRLIAIHGKSGSIYPLGSGMAKSLKEYIEIVKDIIDPKASIGYGEMQYAPKQVMYLVADISALQKDTGFVPRTAFEQGIINCVKD